MPSTIPSPPGVIGTLERTLARPKATMSPSRGTTPPKARRNTHSAAASSSQLAVAQPMTELSSLGSEARSRRRAATWRTTAAAWSSSKLKRRASERRIRSARA